MAQFCSTCGSALAEGSKFCSKCGAPVLQVAPPEQPQQSQFQPQPPQPRTSIPERPVRNDPANMQKLASVVKKKSKVGLIAAIVILLAAALGVVGFFGFREGGWFRGESDGKVPDAQSVQSILDYAKQLEKAGNDEAAAAVYELVPKGIGGELNSKAHEDDPKLKVVDEARQITEIIRNGEGGSGE